MARVLSETIDKLIAVTTSECPTAEEFKKQLLAVKAKIPPDLEKRNPNDVKLGKFWADVGGIMFQHIGDPFKVLWKQAIADEYAGIKLADARIEAGLAEPDRGSM